MPLLHESIADIPEKDLVARVLSDRHYRQTLMNIKGLVSAGRGQILEQIEVRHFRKELTSEVDILVLPEDHIDEATAIQVKRFKAKVAMGDDGFDQALTGHPRRFQELIEKGIAQAN